MRKLILPILILLACILVQASDYVNVDFYLQFSDYLNKFLDKKYWEQITVLGDGLALICISYIFIFKDIKIVLALDFAMLLGGVISRGLKVYFSELRPYEYISGIAVESSTYSLHDRSFPSGHSVAVAAFFVVMLWVFLTGVKNKSNQIILTLVGMAAVSVLLSRMALGAHWPLDVIAGCAIGWLSGGLTWILFEKYETYLKGQWWTYFLLVFQVLVCTVLLLRIQDDRQILFVSYGALFIGVTSILYLSWKIYSGHDSSKNRELDMV